MGNITDHQAATAGARKVRMAYTLNNFQPVLCTILSDQPYFYMDENVEDDDDVFDEATMDALERDIAGLQQKISTYEKMSDHFAPGSESRFDEFLQAGEQITGAKPTPVLSLDDITALIGKSRMAQSLLDDAAEHGVILSLSAQIDTAAYDRDGAKILINPSMTLAEATLLTVRELRRHYQHRAGAMLHPLTFVPDHGVLINRAQRADLAIAMLRTGWELQLAGEKDIWARLENSSMADLARAFAREAHLDFRTLNNGGASAAVFETWFLSERCRAEDKKLIQAMLADYQGYVFGSDQVSRSVSAELICALGQQPYGKNYLADYARMIMTDPVFTEVRDRSNANFLWFIKFERSFKETEHELQSGGEDIHSSGVHPGLPQTTAGDRTNEALSGPLSRFSKKPAADAGLESGADGDNVIHVAFGSFRSSQGEAV